MSESVEPAKTVKFKPFPKGMLFDEYRLFVEDTARFSDRRQAFSNVMVAVNALLATGIFVGLKDLNPHALCRLVLLVALLGAGLAASCVWWKVLNRYDDIIGARNGFLKQIECKVGKDKGDGMHLMLQKFYPPLGPRRGFTALEKGLPWVFIALYCLFLAITILAGLWPLCPILVNCLCPLS